MWLSTVAWMRSIAKLANPARRPMAAAIRAPAAAPASCPASSPRLRSLKPLRSQPKRAVNHLLKTMLSILDHR